jgi:multidrug resistance protein, MATE family
VSLRLLLQLCGQSWGAGNRHLTGIWLQFGLLLTTVLSFPVFLWYWCVGAVLEYSTDDQEVIALATTFSRVLSFSVLPSLIYACLR